MAENPGFEPEVQVLPVQRIKNASPSWLAAKMRAICGLEGPNWGPKHAPIHWICRVSLQAPLHYDPRASQPCLGAGLEVRIIELAVVDAGRPVALVVGDAEDGRAHALAALAVLCGEAHAWWSGAA